MMSDASSHEAARATRLAALAAAEEIERATEDTKRKEAFTGKGSSGKGAFMREQEKMVYGGSISLDERLRRGRAGLVRDVD
jgi:hypothetical protein